MPHVVVKNVVRFGLFEANLTDARLTKGGIRVRLQDQPFKILTILLERPGELVSRDELRQQLWPENTYVEFDDGLNTAIRKLRAALSDSADNPRFVETVPRHGYRFLAPVTAAPQTTAPATPTSPQVSIDPAVISLPGEGTGQRRARRGYLWAVVGFAAIAFLAFATWQHRRSSARITRLQAQDVVVLADFENSTDETVFDDALKQALTVDLEQSPFFRLLSERNVSEMLRLMQRSPSDRLTQKVAMEVCNRATARAMIVGSIANLGSEYLVGLTAVQCRTGDPIAHEQMVANRKEDVVEALGKAASKLRARMGESLASIQQHDIPLEQATTISLDALRAYNLALKTWDKQGDEASLPLFKHAIELDPNFAMAYAGLGTIYKNLSESEMAQENITKAYELRDRLTEKERLSIESRYYTYVTGELDKAAQIYRVQQQIHPDSIAAHANLGNIYAYTAQFDKALPEFREALRLDPGRATSYTNVAFACLALNRVDEAEQAIAEARKRHLRGEFMFEAAYWLAFLHGNDAEMQNIVGEASRHPGTDSVLLLEQAKTAAYHGNFRTSREFVSRAAEVAKRSGDRETAADIVAESSVWATESGQNGLGRHFARQALSIAANRDIQSIVAMMRARSGDTSSVRNAAKDLNRRFPTHTLIQGYWLPLIQAALELNRGRPSKALQALKKTSSYDMSAAVPVTLPTLYPAYVRGYAYLAEGKGNLAAAEFQKFQQYHAVIANQPLGALSYVGLARAYAQTHDLASSRTAYEQFFSLWKNADPEVPILRAAKAEYAKLGR